MSTPFLLLSHYLPLLVLPTGFFFVALFTVALLKIRNSRGGRVTTAVAMLYLFVFSLPLTSDYLILTLEAEHPTPKINQIPEADVIILLGGGLNLPVPPRQHAELGPGGDRLLMVHRLYQADKSDTIWIAGGNIFNWNEMPSEASLTKAIFESWGIPEHAVLIEERSRNTWENVAEFKAYADSQTWETFILVTSASHMPRAMMLFQAAGINPIAVSADHKVAGRSRLSLSKLIPQAHALHNSSMVLREYLGRLVYQIL